MPFNKVAASIRWQRRLEKTARRWDGQRAELSLLTERLSRFEQDNAANPEPVAAEFRLDEQAMPQREPPLLDLSAMLRYTTAN